MAFNLLLPGQQSAIKDLSPRQIMKFGQNAQRNGDMYTAIFYYENYNQRKSDNHKVNYQLAELYRLTRNYEKSMKMYEVVVRNELQKYPKAQFYFAQMLKAVGRYEEAYEEFRQFKRNYKYEKDSKDFSRLTRYAMEGCEIALEIVDNPLDVNIEQLSSSVNGAHIEFNPIPINDTSFYYGALLLDSVIYFNDKNIDSLKPVRQFYMATLEGQDWIGRHDFPLPFNKPDIETGNGAFSPDGKRFYFTRCAPNWQNEMVCHIYQSHFKDGQWTKAIKLPENVNLPNYTSTQPTIGRTAKYNREVIYFSSNRPEGKGGLDLWYTVYNPRRQEWKDPKNLGSKVNTPGDEITPFYNLTTRTLYYSSDGQPGLGGLDIFYGIGERRRYTDIKNLGYPINTSYDDLYFTVSNSREYGFFTSNRPGKFYINNETCCDDIYKYQWRNFIRLGVAGKVYPLEKDRFGRAKDYSNFDFMNPPDTIQPIEGTSIALYMKDEASNEMIFMQRDSTNDNGMFYFDILPDRDYQFFVEGFQYFNEEVHLSTSGVNFSDTLWLPPTWINVLSDKAIVLEDILYDFNSAELSGSAKNIIDTTLLVLLTEAPEFIIEIGSHTDSIGTQEYNMELSQQRAESVVAYLISKGIDSERLIAKGYGPTKPIAPNFLPNGGDNPDGRQKNRRTEFKIVGTLNDMLMGDEDEDDFD